jgi:hypothetical protein
MNGGRIRRGGRTAARLALGAHLALAACAGGGEEAAMKAAEQRVVRTAAGSGRWFPGTARELDAAVRRFLDEAAVAPVTGRIVAAISPHAGYEYSGRVAGHTFRALRDNAATAGAPQTLVVLGFSHRGAFPGVALMDGDAIATPIGEAALDKASAAFLAARSRRIELAYPPHRGEHSAENQIPFAQRALPGVPLVVAILGDHAPDTVRDLTDALAALAATRRVTVVASTDLLHDPDYDRVARTDRRTLALIAALDAQGLAARWSYEEQVCCGIGPVRVAMEFARRMGCRAGATLLYRNSGDDHPESRGNWVVGYGAVVFPAP